MKSHESELAYQGETSCWVDIQIEAHVLPTPQAAELYNQLAKKQPVGGLFHTTC
jgi:hypothetical protein